MCASVTVQALTQATASAHEMSAPSDTATRRLIPPFTEEHASLRESLRSFIEREIHPHVHEWEAAQEFPARSSPAWASSAFSG